MFSAGGEHVDKNATGRFIAELRKQKGFTQKELAEKLMISSY